MFEWVGPLASAIEPTALAGFLSVFLGLSGMRILLDYLAKRGDPRARIIDSYRESYELLHNENLELRRRLAATERRLDELRLIVHQLQQEINQ